MANAKAATAAKQSRVVKAGTLTKTKASEAVENAFSAAKKIPAGFVKIVASTLDGKKHDVIISKESEEIVTLGMDTSAKLEAIWKKGARRLVTDFFIGQGWKFAGDGTLASSDLVASLNAFKLGKETLYDFCVQKHPSYKEDVLPSQAALKKMKEGTKAYEKENLSLQGYLRTIRSTANNQVAKVLRYFASPEQAGKAQGKVSETRDQMNTYKLLDSWITDALDRKHEKRGEFKKVSEQKSLDVAISFCRQAQKKIVLIMTGTEEETGEAEAKLPATSSLITAGRQTMKGDQVGAAARKDARKPSAMKTTLAGEVETLDVDEEDFADE